MSTLYKSNYEIDEMTIENLTLKILTIEYKMKKQIRKYTGVQEY